ncbi:MAG TPA: hypothetical protein VGQ65_15665 [Thermoanaerobaculia bacterium]|jgi:hypothetical protein|nr:hypothetical protein [Thermoanaerobaculia bacterium]
MISILSQFLALMLAGFGLFRLWRSTESSSRWVNVTIATGLLARAVAGQLLFWISYLRLPIARGMQMGDGFWFFAGDGALEYFPTAALLARAGLRSIIEFPTSAASVGYVKTLALTIFLLGTAASVGVLLNLFFYLGIMAVIVRWSEHEPRARMAPAIAIGALSLSPACFLWSLQPLKDTFFQFVVIAFIAACAAWQRTWATPAAPLREALWSGTAMLSTLLAIAAVRWYFAFALLAAMTMFLFLVATMFRGRKAIAFSASAVLLVLLSRVFLFGGGAYVPPAINRALSPSTAIAEIAHLPSSILAYMETTRAGFDLVGGRTSIRPGARFVKAEAAPAANEGSAKVAGLPPVPVPMAPPMAATPSAPAAKLGPKPSNEAANAMAAPNPSPTTPVIAVKTVKNAPTVSVRPAAIGSTAIRTIASPIQTAAKPPAVAEAIRETIMSRLVTGVAAVVLPRSLGEQLGLFHIGGGQGLFWFTEIDTILFDFIILCAVIAVASHGLLSWRSPLLWLLAVITVLAGVPLGYIITNYGTLFRLRAMVFVGLALIPLALATSVGRDPEPALSTPPTS